MNAIELGKFIAILRNEKGLTQEGLAEKLFIDKKKVSRWECGRSIPEFELLIELTKILDVSLYELSICKRIPKEKLPTKIINKFKSIRDLRKYKFKKIIVLILIFLLAVFFTMTTIYTLKTNGTVEIYEFRSLDDKYIINGNYIITKKYYSFKIANIYYKENMKSVINESDMCDFEVYNGSNRINYFDNISINKINNIIIDNKSININESINLFSFKAKCNSESNNNEYNIKFKLIKVYDNKLF